MKLQQEPPSTSIRGFDNWVLNLALQVENRKSNGLMPEQVAGQVAGIIQLRNEWMANKERSDCIKFAAIISKHIARHAIRPYEKRIRGLLQSIKATLLADAFFHPENKDRNYEFLQSC